MFRMECQDLQYHMNNCLDSEINLSADRQVQNDASFTLLRLLYYFCKYPSKYSFH